MKSLILLGRIFLIPILFFLFSNLNYDPLNYNFSTFKPENDEIFTTKNKYLQKMKKIKIGNHFLK